MSRLNFVLCCLGALAMTTPFFMNFDFAGKLVSTKLPELSILTPLSGKTAKKEDLWNCTCLNLRNTDACSKGYAFHSMTAAAQYSKSKCGGDCTLSCQAKWNEGFDNPKPKLGNDPNSDF